MTMKTEINQIEFGQTISQPATVPGYVQLARFKNMRSKKKTVVVKRYNLSDISDDISVTDHIQHEVAAMKQFDHPNILSCLTSLVNSTQVWVITPLAEYGSVRELLKQDSFKTGLPELAICMIVRDLCHALEYLHNQGVVHRAVRASHVLVTESAAKLSGLRYSTDLQATGEGKPNLYSYPLHGVTANLAWLAPEILQQNLLGYNESSDIYSLAVTICEMANGVVPFSDMEPTLMMVEKLHGATPTLLNPALSSHFHQLVAVCCSIDQQHRPTARDLLVHPCIKQLKKTNSTLGTILSGMNKIEFKSCDQAKTVEVQNKNSVISAWNF